MNMTGDKSLPVDESHQGRPVFLMISLFLLLVLYPVSGYILWGEMLISIGLSLMLISATWAIHSNRRVLIVASVPGLAWLVLAWLEAMIQLPESLNVVKHVSLTAFILLILGLMVLSVMRTERVTGNTICRAVSAYLLIGIAWFVMYSLIMRYNSGAFSLNTTAGVERGQPIASGLLYMSFCTLTTLGYGDITPISPLARGLAMLEATIGPLYLAILVARLVALYTREKLHDR